MVPRRIRVLVPTRRLMLSGLGLLWGCGTTGPDFVVQPRSLAFTGRARVSGFGRDPADGIRPFAIRARRSERLWGRESLRNGGGRRWPRQRFGPRHRLRCPMIPQIDRWVTQVVEPAVRRAFRTGARRTDRPCLLFLPADGQHPWRNHLRACLRQRHRHWRVQIGQWRNNQRSTAAGTGRIATRRSCALSTTGHANISRPCSGRTTTAITSNHFHLDLAHHGRDGLMRICK